LGVLRRCVGVRAAGFVRASLLYDSQSGEETPIAESARLAWRHDALLLDGRWSA
jgi:hypothetical protein